MYSKVFSALKTEQITLRTTISDLRNAWSQNVRLYWKASGRYNSASQKVWGPCPPPVSLGLFIPY